MKSLLAGIVGVLVANGAWAQCGVLVLGGPPPVPLPLAPVQQVAYAEQTAYQDQAPTTIVVQGPVVIQQVASAAPCNTASYAGGAVCAPPAATVIYVAGPGGCANNYRPAISCSPNVVYFGRMQAGQQGYNFTYRR